MALATLTSKGQVTVPQVVRDALGLHPGSRIDFVAQADGSFKIMPQQTDVPSLKGRFAGRVARPVTLEEMDRAIAEGAVRSALDGR